MAIRYIYESGAIDDYVGRVFMLRSIHKRVRDVRYYALVWHPFNSRPKFAWIRIHIPSWTNCRIHARVDADLTGQGRIKPEILVLWDEYQEKNPLPQDDKYQYYQELKLRS